MVLRGKKNKNCDAADLRSGDNGDQWDHVAVDVESRLVISMIPGKRTAEQTRQLVRDFAERTGGQPPRLITSDDYSCYRGALSAQYTIANQPNPGLVYATVCKKREKGRVVEVRRALVFGTKKQLAAALEASACSNTVNTSYVERYNGTDRHFNSRKVRETCAFSKNVDMHVAASWIGITVYNFCRPNRALVLKDAEGKAVHRTPAMAAGLKTVPLRLTDIAQTQLVTALPHRSCDA